MQSSDEMIQVALPYTGIEELRALEQPLATGWLTQGPKVKAFEELFAETMSSTYALATSSCTTALHLALLAIGIGPGDIVLVPSFTWVATANAVVYCGAVPLLCDSDLSTYNICPHDLERKIGGCLKQGKSPKAIVAVHLFGLCANMEAILEIAQRYHLSVIEDAACAVGAKLNGKPAGTLSRVGCFSFHPRKIITTGEGGMCITDEAHLEELINSLRSHGASISEEQRHNSSKPYHMADYNHLGFNYRMTDLQGAVGVVQLGRLAELLSERQKWASYYLDQLKGIEWLYLPHVPEGYQHAWQAFVCRVDEARSPKTRNEIMEHLYSKGISTRPGTHSIHQLGHYSSQYGYKPTDLPNAKLLYETTIAIPLHNKMVEGDFKRIVDTLKAI